METLLIIIAFVIFISIIGLLIDVSIIFDVGSNDGQLVIKLFKVPIAKLDLSIEDNILGLSKQKKKKKSFNFKINKKNLSFIKSLKNNFAHRIYISNIDIDCFFILDNPAIVCLISSSIKSFLSFVKFKVMQFQNDADITTNVFTGFGDNKVVVMLDLKVAISIIDFVWACLKTIFERRYSNGKRYRKFNY